MRTSSRLLCMALLLAFGVTVGLGWGSVTHVWFADKLGVKFGPLNQNEIYGAVLPDLFGYEFSNKLALDADYALHSFGSLYWALYDAATSTHSREAEAAIYGMFTHSNAPEIKGADWYAHGPYPIPGEPYTEAGWVIRQGNLLSKNQGIHDYVVGILFGSEELAAGFLPVVGHTLVETAVDILVKRYEDPLVGARLYLGAKNRTEVLPQVLASVLERASSDQLPFPSAEYTIDAEKAYREQMMGYGQLFLLPEPRLIAVLSGQTASLAQSYLKVYFEMAGVTQPVPSIDPAMIANFIGVAIRQVKPIYRQELMAELFKVEMNMRKNAPPPAGPIFAFWGKETIQDEFEGIQTPETKPAELALDQNYPNPFNPTTTIAFALPSDQIVTLKVYNTIGQEVATLVNEFKTAGRYSAVWDARGVPSGVYFCRLQARPPGDGQARQIDGGQAGGVVETKKMTLLK
jgi:hypothetical protein